jgi:pantetheine-phosphate adenylyltransferase
MFASNYFVTIPLFHYFLTAIYEKELFMKKVLYPGTFDPVTYGHIDLIKRAIELFDEVIVTIAINPSKTPLFTIEERIELIKESVKDFPRVKVDTFEGLVVDYAHKVGAVGMIRGLRAISDFEFEFQMALMNRKLANDLHTIFLMPHEKYTYLNSSIVRNLASLNSDINDFVPPAVSKALKGKFNK